MIFPYMVLALALFGVLGYFARKNITWTNKAGTGGSIGMGFIVLIVFALIGWMLDAALDWSVIPQYMYAAGGTLGAISIAFFALFGLLCISMLTSAAKCGTMVA